MSQTFTKSNISLFTAGSTEVLLTQKHVSCFIDISLCHDVIQIDSGVLGMIALTKQGNVYGRGENGFGELGLGDINARHAWTHIPFQSKVKQVSCKHFHTLFLTEEGQVYSCGLNDYGQLVKFKDLLKKIGNF